MYFDPVGLIDFCVKNNITIEQYAFCYLHYYGPKETKKYACLYKYATELKPRGFSPALIQDLVKKGFIIDENKPGESHPDQFILTRKFLKQFKANREIADFSDAIWETYPMHLYLNGTKFIAKNVGPEELIELIKHKIKHGRISDFTVVLSALRSQIENGDLCVGLRKWIETEGWLLETEEIGEYGENL